MSETEAQTTKKRTKKDDYIVQGSILAAAAVLTKIIGVVYRIPLTNILGDEGNGFYGYAYQVYAIALMISSFSLPTAVSKLVSIRLAKRQRRNAFRVFICSLAFAIGVGLFISLTIFLGAGLISTHLMKSPLSVYALRVLAPGLLIVAVMAVIRGYFQGMGTMLPTAISQIIEQVFNAVISIVGASVLFGIGTKAGEKSGERNFSDLLTALPEVHLEQLSALYLDCYFFCLSFFYIKIRYANSLKETAPRMLKVILSF